MLSCGGEENFIYHTSAAQFKKQKTGVSFSLCFDRVLSDKSNEPCPAFVRYRYPTEITPQIFDGYDIMCRDICQTRNGQRAHRNFNLPMFSRLLRRPSAHPVNSPHGSKRWTRSEMLSVCFYKVDWRTDDNILCTLKMSKSEETKP